MNKVDFHLILGANMGYEGLKILAGKIPPKFVNGKRIF